jgi:hypothetical protein
MTPAVTPTPAPDAAPAAAPKTLTPLDFLASLGGPSPEQIDFIKQQSPNNRARVMCNDGKRAFVVRAIGGLELAQIRKNIPQNSTNPDEDTAIAAAVLCTVWTNVTPEKRLNETLLRTGSAGLPSSLWSLITMLSDYMDPQDFEVCSAEL